MNEDINLIDSNETSGPLATDRLLTLVYDELRKAAANILANELPGQTLQPTALVHEVYLRLVGGANPAQWNNRGHFFSAASEAMRRILIDHARQKQSQKRGGGNRRQELTDSLLMSVEPSEDLLALDEAIENLKAVNPRAAEIVQLRYFGGLTLDECSMAMGISIRSAGLLWSYARAWLREALDKSTDVQES